MLYCSFSGVAKKNQLLAHKRARFTQFSSRLGFVPGDVMSIRGHFVCPQLDGINTENSQIRMITDLIVYTHEDVVYLDSPSIIILILISIIPSARSLRVAPLIFSLARSGVCCLIAID